MSLFTNAPSNSAQKTQQGVQRHSLNQLLVHSSHSVSSAAPTLAPTHPETATYAGFLSEEAQQPFGVSLFQPPNSDSFQSLVAQSQVEVELDKPDESGESEEEKSCSNGGSVDYSSWKADEVRKECTRRGLKVKGNLKKDERIKILQRHDMLQASIGSNTIDSTSVSARTKHCMYRLLNLLFSDEFATQFSQSGDKPPRAVLDIRAVNDRSCFWTDVQDAFAATYAEDHPVYLLHFEDDFFKDIDPSVTKAHSARKLFEMWKDVNKHYIVAEKKFNTSGQHENEFRNFVQGRGYVLYLQKWLTVKPELTNFTKGGMLPEDELDTLVIKSSQNPESNTKETTPSKSKRKSAETLERLAVAFDNYVNDRRVEAEHAKVDRDREVARSQLKEKSAVLSLLNDIRHHLHDIDKEIAASRARGESPVFLEEDRVLLLQERQSLIDRLRSFSN